MHSSDRFQKIQLFIFGPRRDHRREFIGKIGCRRRQRSVIPFLLVTREEINVTNRCHTRQSSVCPSDARHVVDSNSCFRGHHAPARRLGSLQFYSAAAAFASLFIAKLVNILYFQGTLKANNKFCESKTCMLGCQQPCEHGYRESIFSWIIWAEC
jgi:hypothetical protein